MARLPETITYRLVADNDDGDAICKYGDLTEDRIFVDVECKAERSDEEGTIVAVISTGSVDRMGEIVEPKGMDSARFMTNPVVLWAHDYSQPPIGKALWVKPAKRDGRPVILAKMRFAKTERAQEVYELYRDGVMSAFSIGFRPTEPGHRPTPKEVKSNPEYADASWVWPRWELLEFSAVPVPANADALAETVKSAKKEEGDDADSHGIWVTPENVDEYIIKADLVPIIEPAKGIDVATWRPPVTICAEKVLDVADVIAVQEAKYRGRMFLP